MTDSAKSNDNDVLIIEADVCRRETVPPRGGLVWKALEEVVAFLPAYRNSREGRKKRKNMKIVIGVIGAGLLLAGGTAQTAAVLWLVLGALIVILAFVIPVEELQKRTWRTALKKKQNPQKRSVWGGGQVVHDGRRVELHTDSERVRKVGVRRDKHKVEMRREGQRTCLGILPMSRNVEDGIWICTGDEVSVDTESDGRVDADEMNHPARVDGADWERLWNRLHDQG